MAIPVVGTGVGAAGTGVVEQDHPERVLESGSDVPPHVLVTAEPVGEDERLPVREARADHVEPLDHPHPVRLPARPPAAGAARSPGG